MISANGRMFTSSDRNTLGCSNSKLTSLSCRNVARSCVWKLGASVVEKSCEPSSVVRAPVIAESEIFTVVSGSSRSSSTAVMNSL